MARDPFDSLVLEKTLHIRNSFVSDELSDESLAIVEAHRGPITKNVCARCAPELADQIDEVCMYLGISKRRFLESAFRYAVDRARQIIRDEGLMTPEGVRMELEIDKTREPIVVQEVVQ